MSTAILFNGAASLIAQEAGILDLLLGNIPDVQGVLNTEDVTFVGGLSSGALMSFVFNAAFGVCEEPRELTWADFKENILFPMTTEQIYNGRDGDFFDTKPLSRLLTQITDQVGYKLIQDLPFRSAIVIRYASILANKNYWLTNISEVANVLPSGDLKISANIKAHQPKLDLVSSLMCSTAIPQTFPPQKLYYKDSNSNLSSIKNANNADAKFVDGGFGVTNMVFADYREFFETYVNNFSKFEKIYFISPKFVETDPKTLERINLANSNGTLAEGDNSGDNPLAIMENWTINFLKNIKTYNSEKVLADTIYYCKPEIEVYGPLDFSNEQEQYNATIAWGQNNLDKIALDIEDIQF
ncbi:MAG: patatin-like phospholipase family protein [Nostoc sp. LLA-1]|nr:patatin-like phospholipase family protein [Cyanocohniella sp. LLY]